jgi:hypothetical protein
LGLLKVSFGQGSGIEMEKDGAVLSSVEAYGNCFWTVESDVLSASVHMQRDIGYAPILIQALVYHV